MSSTGLHARLATAGLTRDGVADLFAAVSAAMRAEVEVVRSEGDDAWPVVQFADVAAGTVAVETRDRIARRGCAVIRRTFDPVVARRWDDDIATYLQANDFDGPVTDEPGRPRIWGIYWSPSQVAARQHPSMATVRRFLNSFWRHESHGRSWFDPDRDIGYPDRLRRRAPGIAAAGLPPHCDGAVSGGWKADENLRVFAALMAGGFDAYDPWDAAHRTEVADRSAAPSSVFRTFQGWTALSEMHPSDGVLHAIPIPSAAAHMFVRGLADELGLIDGEPTDAPRRFRADDLLLPALVPIPAVEPGDTVWWHGDVIHSVAAAANDVRWGNVMYIAATPGCARNDAYRTSMLERFVAGRSPLDFPDEDIEGGFVGRPTLDDLDEIGRRHFGITSG